MSPPPKRPTGAHEAVRESSQVDAGAGLAGLVASAREDIKEMRGEIRALTEALQRHLLACERKHGPLDPRLSQLEQTLAAQTEAVARMDPRLRRLEDGATAEGAQRLHGRLIDLEAAEVARAQREAAASAERSLLGKLAPLLLPVAGGGLAGAVVQLLGMLQR